MKRYKLTLGYLFIFFVFTFSCRPEGEIVRANLQDFSVADQAKIGNELASHIAKNPVKYSLLRPSNNPKLYSYLDEVLKLAVRTDAVENRDEFNWDISVVDDIENMSSFTLPGGKLYITTGFLKFLTSETDLIAVLSHEMYYSDRGTAMEILQSRFSGLILGDIIFNNPVQELDAMVEVLQTEEIATEEVLEADRFSLELMCPFNYRADVIGNIIQKVSDPDFPLEWLLTRPSYEARVDTIMTRSIGCGPGVEETRYQECVINLLD